MVLTVSFVLSPVIGLYCHRHPRDAKHHRKLDASAGASGPHDFAVRSNIARRTPLACPTLPRPPHPCPTSVTIAKRPSWWARDSANRPVIWVKREAEYFCARGWTGFADLPDEANNSCLCPHQRLRADRLEFVLELMSRGAGPTEGCSLLQEGECLLNEGSVVLEDAAVPGVREDAQLCIRQPTSELE